MRRWLVGIGRSSHIGPVELGPGFVLDEDAGLQFGRFRGGTGTGVRQPKEPAEGEVSQTFHRQFLDFSYTICTSTCLPSATLLQMRLWSSRRAGELLIEI